MSLTIVRKVSVTGGNPLRVANNLGDVANTATARTNLGLGTADSPTFSNINTTGNGTTIGPGGTGTDNSVLSLAGSSAASYGAQIRLFRNSTNYWSLGHHSGIQGGASNDLLLYNQIAGNESLRVASATGNLKFGAYGAGALTTDSSGNVTATSDERAKNILGDFTTGLAAVMQLTPKIYKWKAETGLNSEDVVVSLTAQNLIAAGVPEAVSTYRTVPVMESVNVEQKNGETQSVLRQCVDQSGTPRVEKVAATYTVSDRAIIALLVNAIKELSARVEQLESEA